jgi:hypothetical protein
VSFQYQNRGGRSIRLVLAMMAAAALSCSSFGRLFGRAPETGEQIATLESQLSIASATGTAASALGLSSNDQPLGETFSDDFSEGSSLFETGPSAEVVDGALLVGPYEQCATDVANFDAPVDCVTICSACGSLLSDYELATTLSFSEGLSDREFGVVLRFVDQNADSLIDRDDYLLALGFDSYANKWRLYIHEPGQRSPWHELRSGRAGFLTMGRLNYLRAVASENGRRIEVSLNDSPLMVLTGDHPEPGEVLVTPWADAGSVGIVVLGRGVQARYDDFQLTAGP